MRRGPQVLDVGGPEGLYTDGGPIKLELVGLVFEAGPRRALLTERRRGVECEAARGRRERGPFCSSECGAALTGWVAPGGPVKYSLVIPSVLIS